MSTRFTQQPKEVSMNDPARAQAEAATETEVLTRLRADVAARRDRLIVAAVQAGASQAEAARQGGVSRMYVTKLMRKEKR
jgi:hypothetical protein